MLLFQFIQVNLNLINWYSNFSLVVVRGYHKGNVPLLSLISMSAPCLNHIPYLQLKLIISELMEVLHQTSFDRHLHFLYSDCITLTSRLFY